MNRVQFLELFDFIAAAFKGTTLKKQQKIICFFWEGLHRGRIQRHNLKQKNQQKK